MSKITTWLDQEIIYPVRHIWQSTVQYLALFLIISILIQGLTFLIMPKVWLPVKTKILSLQHPESKIVKGKISNIVLQQNAKKYIANCAWQMPEIEQLCESSTHQQQLKIQAVQFIYLTTAWQSSKGAKEQTFIQSIILESEHHTQQSHLLASNANQQLWIKAQYKFVHIIRTLLILNILYMAVAFFVKIKSLDRKVLG